MIKTKAITEVARGYIGTPFHHQGRCKGVGVDCIGLIAGVATELGIEHNDSTAYSRYPDGQSLIAGLKASGLEEVELGERQPGDVLAFWIRKPDRPQHVAILTDRGLVHAYASVARVVEARMDEWWRGRLHSVWRYPQTEGE